MRHPLGCHCATCAASRDPGFRGFVLEEFVRAPLNDAAMAWLDEHMPAAKLEEVDRGRNVHGQLVTVRASRDRRLTLLQTWPSGCEPAPAASGESD